jgi:hypothetical protein
MQKAKEEEDKKKIRLDNLRRRARLATRELSIAQDAEVHAATTRLWRPAA